MFNAGTGFWTIAAQIRLGNHMGDWAYLTQATTPPETVALTDPVAARAFDTMPVWAWAAYALAVGAGTTGAVLLIMRRKVAWAFFAVSTASATAQFGWSFLGFGILAAKGWTAAIFPAAIISIALASMLYAQAKARDGTLR